MAIGGQWVQPNQQGRAQLNKELDPAYQQGRAHPTGKSGSIQLVR